MLAFLPGGVIPPPSPFTRSSYRRFREDTWPALRDRIANFWRGPYRNFVLAALLVGVAAVFAFSLRRLDPIVGQIVHEGGAPAVGTEVTVARYLSRVRGFENDLRPLTFTYGEANDALSDQSVLLLQNVVVGSDGRFSLPGGWALGWPRWRGPFVNLSLRAADSLSGQKWPVPRFRVGDGTEVAGAFDSALAAGKDLTALLAKMELAAPRILDLAAQGDRVASAEGIVGVRLYRRTEAGKLELFGHRPGAQGLYASAVGFMPAGVVVLGNHGFEVLDGALPALPSKGAFAGLFSRFLGFAEDGAWVSAPDVTVRLSLEEPVRVLERLTLGDKGPQAVPMGPDVLRMSGSLIAYLHSEGNVRLVNLASAFRTPATLADRGGPVLDFDFADRGEVMLVISKGGVSAYSIGRPETIDRIGELRLDLRPWAVRGRAVVGAKGVAVLGLTGKQPVLERLIPVALGEIEAASSFVQGEVLLIPMLGEPVSRTEEREFVYDPLRGGTEVVKVVVRDSIDLRGVREVDLATGSIAEKLLPAPLRVRLREDGYNRQVVYTRFEDGSAVYARADGTLWLASWGGGR